MQRTHIARFVLFPLLPSLFDVLLSEPVLLSGTVALAAKRVAKR